MFAHERVLGGNGPNSTRQKKIPVFSRNYTGVCAESLGHVRRALIRGVHGGVECFIAGLCLRFAPIRELLITCGIFQQRRLGAFHQWRCGRRPKKAPKSWQPVPRGDALKAPKSLSVMNLGPTWKFVTVRAAKARVVQNHLAEGYARCRPQEKIGSVRQMHVR